MTYLIVNIGSGFHLLKSKGQLIYESVKAMRVGDTTRVEKKDLSCFYAVARRHDLVFRRKKDGDAFIMVMVRNGYLDKQERRRDNWDAQ